MEKKFLYCRHCGNLVGTIKKGGGTIICCGEEMSPLKIKDSYDTGSEKHVPIVRKEDGVLYVSVGAVTHPMTDEHHIDWIFLETLKGGQRKICLDQPKAVFAVAENTPIAVYAYCNLHGLWSLPL